MAVPEASPERAVFAISVAAQLSGAGVAALRSYERAGLLDPARTAGGTRRYSTRDIARVRRILDLVAAGVNLAGIGRILDLQDHNAALRDTLDPPPPSGRDHDGLLPRENAPIPDPAVPVDTDR